jgi:hypothetical protein
MPMLALVSSMPMPSYVLMTAAQVSPNVFSLFGWLLTMYKWTSHCNVRYTAHIHVIIHGAQHILLYITFMHDTYTLFSTYLLFFLAGWLPSTLVVRYINPLTQNGKSWSNWTENISVASLIYLQNLMFYALILSCTFYFWNFITVQCSKTCCQTISSALASWLRNS